MRWSENVDTIETGVRALRQADMSSNHTQRHGNVGVVSVEAVEAPEVVTSAWIDEQLADVFARCDVRPGTARGARRDQAAALVARGDALRRGGRARRRAGDRGGGNRPLRDRHAHLDLGLQAPPGAVGRLRRAPPPRPRAGLPQLRSRQCVPRLRQRDPPRRNRDRGGPDPVRPDRGRRGVAPHPADDDRAPAGERAGHGGRLRRVREPDAGLGRRGDGARQPRPAARTRTASSVESPARRRSTTRSASATSSA